MKTVLVLFASTAMLFTSCREEYTCYCTNPGGTNPIFSTKGSFAKAQRECEEYYQENFGSIPWNETMCEAR